MMVASDPVATYPNPRSNSSIYSAIALILMAAYITAWCLNISPFWFNPQFTTDDAFQQAYPFHEAIDPGIFSKDDLISEMILGYLPPLHYWISYLVTLLTKNAILTGHWVMALQIIVAALFLFRSLFALGGTVPAAFGTAWFFHTTSVMNRITLGLARGWAPGILTAFLYYLLQKNLVGMAFVVLLGVLLNPPMALLCLTAMGLLCLWELARGPKDARPRILKIILITTVLFAVPALISNARSPRIGKAVSYSVAEKMPEFHARGRFEFVPMMNVFSELREYAFVAFLHSRDPSVRKLRHVIPPLVVCLLLALVFISIFRKRELLPPRMIFFLGGITLTYAASRLFAFRLFVPDRYLMIPLAILSIVGVTIAFWRLFPNPAHRVNKFMALLVLAFLVNLGTGSGLNANMNFNRDLNSYGEVWNWIHENTPRGSTIGGDPVHIDPAMLLGHRRAYATMETAFPLFDAYHHEISRRLNLTIRAHYAKTIDDFLIALGNEPIDYFVFKVSAFADDHEYTKRIFHPYTGRAFRIYLQNTPHFAYYELLSLTKDAPSPIVPFHDSLSLVVNVKALRNSRPQ